MNVDLEDIRTIVNRHPNIRGKNLLHQLEKRRKVEELRKAQYRHMTGETQLQKALDEGRFSHRPSSILQWLLKRRA